MFKELSLVAEPTGILSVKAIFFSKSKFCTLCWNFDIWYRLAESALDALSNMLTHPDSHKYPSTCIRFLEKLLPLKQIIEAQQQQRDGAERDQVSRNAVVFVSEELHSKDVAILLTAEKNVKWPVYRLNLVGYELLLWLLWTSCLHFLQKNYLS